MSNNFEGSIKAVKKPADDRPLTAEEEIEWMKCAEDPWYFFNNYCYVQGPRGKVLFEPREYQVEMLEVVTGNRFSVLNAPRQVGKSGLLAVYSLWNSIFTPNFTVGITSFTNANVIDVIRRCKFTYEALPDFLKPAVKIYNQKEIIFLNDSIIYGQVTSENALRGRTNQLIICDEFSFVPEAVAQEFYTAILPSMTADGEKSKTRVIFCSTPNGSSGLYAQLAFGAMSGTNGFAYLKVDYTKIPNRTEQFYKDMEKKLGKNRVDSEYRGEFISDKGTLVNSRVIEAIETRDPIRTVGDLEIFVDSFANRKLMLAADVSEGIGQDYHAFQVFDVDTLEQVAEYHNNVMNQHFYAKAIVSFIELAMKENCGDFYYTVENNGVGAGVIRLLEASENEYLANAQMISDPNGKKSGLATTGATKAKSCATFKQMMEMDKFKVHSEKLKVQLKFFVKKGNTFAAESGMHDDLVMACIVMVNMMEQLANYEDNVWDVVHELDDDGGEAVYDIYF